MMRAQQEAQAARARVTEAQTEAERARANADLSRAEAEQARLEAQAAHEQVAQSHNDAEQARANEALAREKAEQAQLQADQATRERDALQQRLYVSISQVLEARREARGLIVNLSDVLFDFNKATLKSGAREKLNRLAGILLAYPGQYHIEIEGHTDSVGSDDYNLKLSQERAESVRECLQEAAIAADRIVATRGLGKASPVASNDTATGRQLNRRVELVITDVVPLTSMNQR
jgi:outer membrane protein OmpA-like peptidoglycan-associated protein